MLKWNGWSVAVLGTLLVLSGCDGAGMDPADAGDAATGLDGTTGDPCAVDNGGCDPATTCSVEDGVVMCGDCPLGYEDDGAGTCVDTDECETDNGGCDQTCTNDDGSFSCACDDGYTLNEDGATCDDVDECETDNGGCDEMVLCTNTPGARECGLCPMGYEDELGDGTSCVDIDECAVDNGGCSDLVVCTNAEGGFTCGDCPMGYLDDGAGGCVDIDECATSNGGCDALTSCTNTPGSRTCGACPGGYTGDGEVGCVNVDECATANGGCAQTCTDAPGSFSCSCDPGYTLNADGASCDDVDECATANGGCAQTCTNSAGSFSCSCDPGYTLNGDGASCDDVDECATANGGCGDATMYACTNVVGGPPTCSCASGYQDNDMNGTCEATCATAAAGDGYEGTCSGCGTSAASWNTARNNARSACVASGCSEGCSLSMSAGDNCGFDGSINGYRCTSYCGAPPLTCGSGESCDDASGTATCVGYRSCDEIHTADPSAADGTYIIDPDGAGGSAPISVTCDMTTAGGGWTVISFEDFSGSASGWSDNRTTTCGTASILGGYNTFSNGATSSVQKTFGLLGVPHSEARVTLSYWSIDSWDGEQAYVRVDGADIFRTSYTQSTGAGICGGGWLDRGPNPVAGQPGHSTNSLTVQAGSTLDQGPTDESWGIDDVRVMIR